MEDEEAYWEAYSDLAEQLAEQALEEAEEALEEAEKKAALATEEALEKEALKEHLDELGAERAQKIQWASEFRVGDEVCVQRNLFWMAAVVAGKEPGGFLSFQRLWDGLFIFDDGESAYDEISKEQQVTYAEGDHVLVSTGEATEGGPSPGIVERTGHCGAPTVVLKDESSKKSRERRPKTRTAERKEANIEIKEKDKGF